MKSIEKIPCQSMKNYTVENVSFTMVEIPSVENVELGDKTLNNNPPHIVSLSSYSIGQTLVTQELWEEVMCYNHSFFQVSNKQLEKYKQIAKGEIQEKLPVESVTWYECIAFCNELTKKVMQSDDCVYFCSADYSIPYTKNDADKKIDVYMNINKKGFRLPTEAQWEYAAMGGTTNKYAGTSSKRKLIEYAWYNDADKGDSGEKTHEVAKKKTNGYGLYDMSGNVWEWCYDLYNSKIELSKNTTCATERVIRGGSCGSGAVTCERAYRNSFYPDRNPQGIGLRLALCI